jgi:hypothetical protein
MPNHQTPEVILIRREEDEAAHKSRPPLRSWPSSPRAAAPRVRVPRRPPLSLSREKAPPSRLPGTLTATRLKVSTTLDAAELLAIPAPNGKPRATLRISLPGRFVTAEISAKSLRRAQAAIRQAGADSIALLLQGHLTASDTIAEAGLSAQPRAAKPSPPAP